MKGMGYEGERLGLLEGIVTGFRGETDGDLEGDLLGKGLEIRRTLTLDLEGLKDCDLEGDMEGDNDGDLLVIYWETWKDFYSKISRVITRLMGMVILRARGWGIYWDS